VLIKTASYTITRGDAGRMFSTKGATGLASGRPFQLPPLADVGPGFSFRVLISNGDGLQVDADGTEKIQVGSAAGVVTITHTDPGELLTFIAFADLWVVESSFGDSVIASPGGLPAATAIGEVLFSVDGATFTVNTPLTSSEGWLVAGDGTLLVVG